jgi:peroxin-11C
MKSSFFAKSTIMSKSFASDTLEEIVSWLSKHDSRDKVVRLLSYMATLAGTSTRVVRLLQLLNVQVSPQDVEQSAKIFSSKLSETRRILRLFDDLPMVKFTLDYGYGLEDRQQVGLQFIPR